MEKLPTDVKQKWVSALRSGEWVQGFGELNDGLGGYCCLGVLAEVLEPGVTQEGNQLNGMCSLREYDEDNPSHFINRNQLQALLAENRELKALADKYREAPALADGAVDESLMCLNDDGKYTFDQLADLIDHHL